MRGVAPAEGDPPLVERNQSMVGNRYAVSVGAEVAECMFRPAEGALGVDDSVLAKQRAQPRAEDARLGEMLEGSVEVEIT